MQKNSFFGVYGVDGGDVLVKTEKIDIQFETSENTNTETAEIPLLISLLSITMCVFAYDIFRKEKEKKRKLLFLLSYK